MSWKRFSYLMLISAILAIVAANIYALMSPPLSGPTAKDLKKAFPAAANFSKEQGTPPYFAAYSKEGVEIGFVVQSDHVEPKIYGYGGEFGVLVGIDKEGVINGLKIFRHKETPAYLSMLKRSGFFDSLQQRKINERLEDIDAVSGATVSAEAIKADVLSAGRTLADKLYKIQVPQTKSKEALDFLPLLAVLALLALALLSHRMGKRSLRLYILTASLVVLGFWLNESVNMQNIALTLLFKKPAATLVLLTITAFAFIGAFLKEPIYCSLICPFGSLQELLYRFIPLNIKVSAHTSVLASRLRWIVLFLSIVFFFAAGLDVAVMFEPFGTPFGHGGGFVLNAFAGFVLLAAALRKRFWCRYFCPTGACLNLATKTAGVVSRTLSKDKKRIPNPSLPKKGKRSLQDKIFIALLALTLAGIVAVSINNHIEALAVGNSHGVQMKFEKVDIEAIEKGVYNNNVSDEKARHWRRVDEDDL